MLAKYEGILEMMQEDKAATETASIWNPLEDWQSHADGVRLGAHLG
jgi:hypothetical protein